MHNNTMTINRAARSFLATIATTSDRGKLVRYVRERQRFCRDDRQCNT
jgi:hypothetical protein